MKILVTTDGSTFSDQAIQTIAETIRPQGNEVLVLEIVEPALYTPPPQMAPGYIPEQAEVLKEQMQLAAKTTAQAAEALGKAGFKADTRVIQCEIRSGILDVAADWKPDLIVLGSHGRRGVEKFLLGSVAESIARHARCSVLIVRGVGKAAIASQAA